MSNQKTLPMRLSRLFPTVPTRPAPAPARRLSWKWLILVATLVGGFALAAFYFRSDRGGVQEAQPPSTAAAPEVRLGYRVGGRVAAVHVKPGQRVEKGQVLVTLEAAELKARRDLAASRLAAAQADLKRVGDGPAPEEVAAAKAAVDAAQARLDKVRSGPSKEQIQMAQAEVDSALVDYYRAEAEFDRSESLLRQRAIARERFEADRAVRDRAYHRLSAARAAQEQVLRGSRPAEVAEARAELERAEANYKLLLRGPRPQDKAAAEAAVALAQAQFDEAETALRETELTATESGEVVSVAVRPGSVVEAGKPVLVVR
jgi:multidrug resistance efflux pump